MNYDEFESRFVSEEDCLNYLFKIRWPNGYCCPRCGCKENWKIQPYKYKCRSCNYQTTVISGTMFQHSHVCMKQWFQAIWYMSEMGRKAKAVDLQEQLKLGSSRTAQIIVENIQGELFTTDKKKINRPLQGMIEIYIDKATSLLIAVEVKNRKTEHIKIEKLSAYDVNAYHKFVLDNIKPGSQLKKDMDNYTIRSAVDGYALPRGTGCRANYARNTYAKFKKYCEAQEKEISPTEYAELNNCFEDKLTFDEILYNAVHYKPRYIKMNKRRASKISK